jgi:hypothetical protein
MIEIADGVVDENNPIPEDVARSKLKKLCVLVRLVY